MTFRSLLVAASVGAVLVATAPTPAGATATLHRHVLQPSLRHHLTHVSATTPVRVMVQAGGSTAAAKRAALAAGLVPETTLKRVGIAVATGLPTQVGRLASVAGVTRV